VFGQAEIAVEKRPVGRRGRIGHRLSPPGRRAGARIPRRKPVFAR
jgi:hypothetical protein